MKLIQKSWKDFGPRVTLTFAAKKCQNIAAVSEYYTLQCHEVNAKILEGYWSHGDININICYKKVSEYSCSTPNVHL